MIIKKIESMREIDKIAAVEAETWGMEPGTTVPDHVLAAISREGGVLLGAYEQDMLIGYTLGWLGTAAPDNRLPAAQRLKLVSHMTGVLAEYRDRRVGYQLKLAQRAWALEQGLELITWTYDPLESRNGYFNVHLLGCVCNTYFRNYYGEMSDQMNQGVQSDRFRVDWWINHPDVVAALNRHPEQRSESDSMLEVSHPESAPAYEPIKRPEGFLVPPDEFEIIDSTRIMVEIPQDFQEIRQSDHDLALCWRLFTREVFESYFSRGYRVIDFIYQRMPDSRSWYVLGD